MTRGQGRGLRAHVWHSGTHSLFVRRIKPALGYDNVLTGLLDEPPEQHNDRKNKPAKFPSNRKLGGFGQHRMLIAIDESGSFGVKLAGEHLFVAVHFRETGLRIENKRAQFTTWEKTLPRSLKNHKGEFKGSVLSDEQLFQFAALVFGTAPKLGITPFALSPSEQLPAVVAKHRHVALVGIREGVKGYLALGRPAVARTYEEFGNWFQRLHDSQFLKIVLLGDCIGNAFVNSVGHAISGRYDQELPDLHMIIDQDFVREKRHITFWKEVLRNQLWHISKETPLPLLNDWRECGHPFLTKFTRNGRLDFNELFTKGCEFGSSHQYPELRIADLTATIVSRHLNRRRCTPAFRVLQRFFLRHGRIEKIVLNDFDLDSWRYDPSDNPFGNPPNNSLNTDARQASLPSAG